MNEVIGIVVGVLFIAITLEHMAKRKLARKFGDSWENAKKQGVSFETWQKSQWEEKRTKGLK